ncbi:hypothetical protein LR48_Vigan08g015600 [Vigna angularis]|uniref:Uncharacterized protein n=1 Tax=Phaseolus angularis TaxID=3914 RepID=A0A0L9V3L0_PHAAN|nr:hypothetical protein LR48_Vigan08g015600 [Vigna angularis]
MDVNQAWGAVEHDDNQRLRLVVMFRGTVVRWPIEDDPIVEEQAFEEQAYEAYEAHVQGEAFEVPDDNVKEEEEHADVLDIVVDVNGFSGSPCDVSLLTHYVQHVAYAISEGRSLRSRGDMYEVAMEDDSNHPVSENKL